MKKEIKELILMVITVIFTIIQLIFFLQNTLTANKETTQLTNISETKNEDVKFSTINDELKALENGIISDINDSGDSWKVKIILDGNKEEILNSLNKLNDELAKQDILINNCDNIIQKLKNLSALIDDLDVPQKRTLLSSVIDKVFVNGDTGAVKIKFKSFN